MIPAKYLEMDESTDRFQQNKLTLADKTASRSVQDGLTICLGTLNRLMKAGSA